MGFDPDSSKDEEEQDGLKYPVGSSQFVTIWLNEGDEEFYFSVKVDAPLLGSHSFNVGPSERASSFVNQVGQSWKENGAGEE